VKLTTHLELVPKKKARIYNHSLLRLHSVVLN
jgi:hypothetical protein